MSIIIKPVVTEKMTAQGEKMKRYGFVVRKNANKIQIKKAVEDLYNVNVESVNTMSYSGKNKSRITRRGIVAGRTSSFKKAIVTLAEGQIIDFYSNI
ncbi:MAG: 50S ribosomal protein L23 [Bacteroidales bacterium]|nr:50S ribosomal protein L23 [Bacteroidales bacterium]MDZ4204457.1 50S ribosomal protein L23 [Bacteroidales bacterium]